MKRGNRSANLTIAVAKASPLIVDRGGYADDFVTGGSAEFYRQHFILGKLQSNAVHQREKNSKDSLHSDKKFGIEQLKRKRSHGEKTRQFFQKHEIILQK